MKPVNIDKFHYLEGNYVSEGKNYDAQDLIKAAKDLPIFDMPLQGICLNHKLTLGTVESFLYHYKRVEAADLEYPIIIDSSGYICDGWHRVTKAILEGRTTIKAKRLEVMPSSY